MILKDVGPSDPVSIEDFLQYAYASYAAAVVAGMRDDDVIKELKNGDALMLLRGLWQCKAQIGTTDQKRTSELGYDDRAALLWASKRQLDVMDPKIWTIFFLFLDGGRH